LTLSLETILADSGAASAVVVEEGVLWACGLVPPESIAAAASEVDARLVAAKTEASGNGDAEVKWFGAVKAREHRCDLKMELTGAVQEVVTTAVTALQAVIEDAATADAQVCELSCIVADPGAPRQGLHADTSIEDGPGLITVFIPLQTVGPLMGATIVLPRSHNQRDHDACDACDPTTGGSALLENPDRGAVQFEAAAGDALVMDSRLLHCGGTNSSDRRRRLLYVTFNVPHNLPTGSTYSLLAENSRLKLRHLVVKHKKRAPISTHQPMTRKTTSTQ
jgi:ectoine hydroxylase-related dioxygenase (phytanoyl-CoA dioxygenase family)